MALLIVVYVSNFMRKTSTSALLKSGDPVHGKSTSTFARRVASTVTVVQGFSADAHRM